MPLMIWCQGCSSWKTARGMPSHEEMHKRRGTLLPPPHGTEQRFKHGEPMPPPGEAKPDPAPKPDAKPDSAPTPNKGAAPTRRPFRVERPWRR